MSLNVNSNAYTIGFAALFVALIAIMLAGFSEATKTRAEANKMLDKQYSILKAEDKSVVKADATKVFTEKVVSYLVSSDGTSKEVATELALEVELKKELKKPESERQIPLYVYSGENGQRFILPMYGSGLWDAISGFMSLEQDFNTISGVSFDHVGETPGLGAEITKDWFQNNFNKEKILNNKGEFVGIKVLKGRNNPKNPELHMVDGMSGATITGDGVQEMIDKCVKGYLPYFQKQKVASATGMVN